VHELAVNPVDWGRESPAGGTVESRKTVKVADSPGYWWRAFDWENYLLSCQICNQQWKQNLFPVRGKRAITPDCPPEESLLLSPFGEFDPAQHFRYGRIGEIIGLTPEGRATIVTCGLDRPSLRLLRYKTARATHEHLDEIGGTSLNGTSYGYYAALSVTVEKSRRFAAWCKPSSGSAPAWPGSP
jgi:hypothetical protein